MHRYIFVYIYTHTYHETQYIYTADPFIFPDPPCNRQSHWSGDDIHLGDAWAQELRQETDRYEEDWLRGVPVFENHPEYVHEYEVNMIEYMGFSKIFLRLSDDLSCNVHILSTPG